MASTSRALSRRSAIKKAAGAVAAGGAGVLVGPNPVSAQGGSGSPLSNVAGRKFRAFVMNGTKRGLETLTLRPLRSRGVLVRVEVTQTCYSTGFQVLTDVNVTPAQIPGHGCIGIVEAVGPQVKRVEVGDRVAVTVVPQCGECYNCMRSRGDRCLMLAEPNAPIAEMADGTPVEGAGFVGGFAEYIAPVEEYVVPLFTKLPSTDLAIMHCVGMTGLGMTNTLSRVKAGSSVVILGLGPIGLSSVQGARINGASRIIGVDPVRYRREIAMKVGATTVLDPTAEGEGLIKKIQSLCAPKNNRKFAGEGNPGPDFVIEAVGGERLPPKVERGPDPTGLTSLRQAWELASWGGTYTTTGNGHPQGSMISFPATQWSNAAKTHVGGQLGGFNSKRDLPAFVTLVETGQFDMKAMTLPNSYFPLERTVDAYQVAMDRTVVFSAVVIPGPGGAAR